MRLLVLGGTRFLGRAIVDDAVSRGYDVTTFSRGLSGHPRPGAEALHGDRTNADDLRQLAGSGNGTRVIDTSVARARRTCWPPPSSSPGACGTTPTSPRISVYAERPGEARHRGFAGTRLPARCHRHRGDAGLRRAQGRLRTRRRGHAARPVPHRPARADRGPARGRGTAAVVAGQAGPGRDGPRPGRTRPDGPDDRRQGPGVLGRRQHAARPARDHQRAGPGGGHLRGTADHLRPLHRCGRPPGGHAALGAGRCPARGGGAALDGTAHVGT